MSGKNTGEHDFKGQPDRGNTGGTGGHGDVRVNKQDQKNKFNGSGGSRRVISPSTVHGSNKP